MFDHDFEDIKFPEYFHGLPRTIFNVNMPFQELETVLNLQQHFSYYKMSTSLLFTLGVGEKDGTTTEIEHSLYLLPLRHVFTICGLVQRSPLQNFFFFFYCFRNEAEQ